MDKEESLEGVLDFYGVRYQTRQGNQRVLCALHSERTPSMSVNLGKGSWFCFACGVGGGPLQLIMHKEGIDFGRAREFAASHGIDTGGSGETDSALRGVQLPSGRRLPGKSRTGHRQTRFTPPWRRV